MSAQRDYVIYLSDGTLRVYETTSLRTALRQAEKEIGKLEILAAVARECLPLAEMTELPFLAVFLRNYSYVPPEL